MDLGSIILTGSEVSLRPLTLEDVPALAAAAAESRESYDFSPVPNGPHESTEYIEHALVQRQSGERYPFIIQWNQRVVGTTSYCDYSQWDWPPGSHLQRNGIPDVVEIGYTWLAHSAQRTSCNTEAKFLLLDYAFEKWEVHRVSLRTDVRNNRSRSAIERLGATFEGIRRADKPSVDGLVRDSAFYSIIKAEWPSVKDRLLSRLSAKTQK